MMYLWVYAWMFSVFYTTEDTEFIFSPLSRGGRGCVIHIHFINLVNDIFVDTHCNVIQSEAKDLGNIKWVLPRFFLPSVF